MIYMPFDISSAEGFDWDEGNLTKNPSRHQVTNEEAEEIFFQRPLVGEHSRPGDEERRWFAIGRSRSDRVLRIVFTLRGRRIRVISARAASRRERQAYVEALRKD
jgi:uncharacterized DUF497 family protein